MGFAYLFSAFSMNGNPRVFLIGSSHSRLGPFPALFKASSAPHILDPANAFRWEPWLPWQFSCNVNANRTTPESVFVFI